MRHAQDDQDRIMMGTQYYPECPKCGRAMIKAKTTHRNDFVEGHNIEFVCCDPRCQGRVRKPE